MQHDQYQHPTDIAVRCCRIAVGDLASLCAPKSRRGVFSAQPEQGLECGHRVLALIIAKEKFIEVTLETNLDISYSPSNESFLLF